MKIRSVIDLILTGISGYFAFYFYLDKEYVYAVLLLAAALFFVGLFIKSLFRMGNPYRSELNKILRTYDSILVEVEVLPKMTGRKTVRTKYFKDMVNVQFELRKPIYYLKGPIGCTFVIMSDDTAYTYEIVETKFEEEKK